MRQLLLLSLIGITTACGQVSTKVKVVDEEGNPIKGAKVTVGFLAYLATKDVYESKDTDDEGISEITGSPEASLRFEVTKENYYKSEYKDLDHTKDHDIEVVLRKRIKPIPLFARKMRIQIPKLNQSFGFDLKQSDWVTPYGNGQISDLWFKAEKKYSDKFNYETKVTIIFNQKFEGMFEDKNSTRTGKFFNSRFKSQRIASLTAYNEGQIFIAKKSSVKGYKGSTVPNNYYFRTRVSLDTNGDILLANYGKFYDSFKVSIGAGIQDIMPKIEFTYYFNPTPNDRNLEFDPQKNLFQGLKREERVTEP